MTNPLPASHVKHDHAIRGADGTVLHYGSAPGELAACLRNVGLAQRPGCRVIVVGGSARAIEIAGERLTGVRIGEGGALRMADIWWVRPRADQLLVLGPERSCQRVMRALGDRVRQSWALRVDNSDRLTTFALLGPRANALLSVYKVLSHEQGAADSAPCFVGSVGETPVVWIWESAHRVLGCVPRADAAAVLRDLEHQGRPLGLVRIGRQAADQFSLFERHRSAQQLMAV